MSITAPAYALISLGFARVIMFEKKLDPVVLRIFLTWTLLAPIGLLFNNPPVQLFLAFFVLMFLKPKDPADRTLYCVGVLPAMHQSLGYSIPFPGLNYLFYLTYWKLVMLVVLFPVYLSYTRRMNKAKWSGVDILVLLYVLYTGVMSIREVSFTSMLRFSIDQFLLIFLPYFVIVRTIDSEERVEQLIKLVYCLAIILAAVGVVSTIKVWDFYRIYEVGITQIYLFRNGFLRINLTINTASLATLMIFALVALEYFRSKQLIAGLKLWGMRALFVAIIYFTGNRGALLQGFMAIGVYFLLLQTSIGFRKFLMLVTAVLVILAIGALPFLDWESFDEHGTFLYRYDIITTSLYQFGQYPIFGKMHYLNTGNFDHLVQGEGIVDIVNWYIQVWLEYGAVGLILFLGIYMKVLLNLYRNFNEFSPDDYRRERYAFMLGNFVPYLVLIGTTSNVSILPLLGIIILALSKAECNLYKSSRRRNYSSVI